MAVSFFGRENHIMLYREHLTWAGLELTTMLMKDTGCICSCKSNCHTITMAPMVSIFCAYLINRRGNQKWTIQRNGQHRVHKTQDDDKQNKKTAQYYVGQQYGQANTNKVNKT